MARDSAPDQRRRLVVAQVGGAPTSDADGRVRRMNLNRSTKYVLTTAACVLALIVTGPGAATSAPPPEPPPATAAQLEAAKLRACHRKHRPDDQWQARAACRVVAVWQGRWRERHEAVRVAWCEDRLSSADRRGTYWGAYQQDADARATYGFGPTIVEQAKSADKMHDARGWQPWPNCRPGGSAHASRWREAPAAVLPYGGGRNAA